MAKYGTSIDRKWQANGKKQTFINLIQIKKEKKLYVLEMFSYPSGSQLHAGHWFNYGPVDFIRNEKNARI